VKLPKIKTLNHQIDVIEANSTTAEARLAHMEELLERIAQRLDIPEPRHDEQPTPEGHLPGM